MDSCNQQLFIFFSNPSQCYIDKIYIYGIGINSNVTIIIRRKATLSTIKYLYRRNFNDKLEYCFIKQLMKKVLKYILMYLVL